MNHASVKAIAEVLGEMGVRVFLDEGGLTGDISMLLQLPQAILASRVFICFETFQYQEEIGKDEQNYCKHEFSFAMKQNKLMVCVNSVGKSPSFLQKTFKGLFADEIMSNEINEIVEYLYAFYLNIYKDYRIHGPLVRMVKYHGSGCYISRSQGKVHCHCGHFLSQYNLLEDGETSVPYPRHTFKQPDYWNAGIINRYTSNEGDLPIEDFYDWLENYLCQYVSTLITRNFFASSSLLFCLILFVY